MLLTYLPSTRYSNINVTIYSSTMDPMGIEFDPLSYPMLKEHCGCGQKTDFDENDETRENYVTTWEVCWSLCQTSQGKSLEGKQHRVQEKFLDFKSFRSLKIGAVPPEAPVYWMVAFSSMWLGNSW